MNICEIYLHNMLILLEKKGAASFRKQPLCRRSERGEGKTFTTFSINMCKHENENVFKQAGCGGSVSRRDHNQLAGNRAHSQAEPTMQKQPR